ncbi:hypothetical protein XOCgx_0442 [Xanthomonas oryzae pv. oryzicola]|nr:hypothetical protein XOCgx_0442 [Xanthomonas oryzae pv. oryzicola]
MAQPSSVGRIEQWSSSMTTTSTTSALRAAQGPNMRTRRLHAESGSPHVASSGQVGAHGALTTAVDAWSMPLPSTGRARLAVSAVVW